MKNNMEYGKRFYKRLYTNVMSAKVIIPIVQEILSNALDMHELKVVDFGCGTGHWLKVWRECGAKEVFGIDMFEGKKTELQIDGKEFKCYDLNKKISLKKKYDVVQCLETAEHIEKENAKTVVSNLVNAGDIILFSAAIPHQRGAHHVNEQWPEYWISLFDQKGYAVIDCIREKVWNNPSVRGFYAQNIFLFCKRDEKYAQLLSLCQYNRESMFNIVHPAVWKELNTYGFMRIIDKMHDNKVIYWIYTTFIKPIWYDRTSLKNLGD